MWRWNGDKHFPAKSFGISLGDFLQFLWQHLVSQNEWPCKFTCFASSEVSPAPCRTYLCPTSLSVLCNSCTSATCVLKSRQFFGDCCLQNWTTKCRMTLFLKLLFLPALKCKFQPQQCRGAESAFQECTAFSTSFISDHRPVLQGLGLHCPLLSAVLKWIEILEM